MYLRGDLHDLELEQQALQNLKIKCNDNKYFKKRILTRVRQQVAPRWASDMNLLKQVCIQQQKDINPDAIFGQIDPRDK